MLCEQIPGLEVVKAFSSPQKLLDEMSTLHFDLLIVDIEMPGINGMQLANLVKNKMIIFATAYKEYAAEAFDLDAIDYVCKPIKKSRLEEAVRKACKRIASHSEPADYVTLNTDKGKSVLYFDQIFYISTSAKDRRDKIVYLQNQTKVTLKNYSIKEILHYLPEKMFCQVNKQEILSIKAVAFFNRNEIITHIQQSNGKQLIIYLGEVYRQNFQNTVMPNNQSSI
jgi:two-component SAPR family response regulator